MKLTGNEVTINFHILRYAYNIPYKGGNVKGKIHYFHENGKLGRGFAYLIGENQRRQGKVNGIFFCDGLLRKAEKTGKTLGE